MMSIVDEIIARDPALSVREIACTEYHEFLQRDWTMDKNNPTGIAIEEGEFLYGLVRLLKPRRVLETGTNLGVSTRFMALAMEHNKTDGVLLTIEQNHTIVELVKPKLSKYKGVVLIEGDVDRYVPLPDQRFDFMFLDTELIRRYGELVRFFPNLTPGGVVVINDLWVLDDSRFGGVPDRIAEWLRDGELTAIVLKNVHGDTMFQKGKDDALTHLIRGV